MLLRTKEAGVGVAFLVATADRPCDPTEAALSAYGQIASALRARGLELFHERIFGSLRACDAVLAARRTALEAEEIRSEGPLTFVEGAPAWGDGLAGIQIQAVAGSEPVWTISDGGRPVGRGLRRDGATWLMLQSFPGLEQGAPLPDAPARQAARALADMARVLKRCGASFRQVARTWFYLRDILSWYGEFNRARNAAYQAFGIAPADPRGRLLLPASTGIGAANFRGAALAVDALAILPSEDGLPEIERLRNPGQKEAFEYGSAFSRAVRIRTRERVFLQLSGTAAIDELGRTLHPGDFRSQLSATFDKIEALLSPQGAGLADIDAATVFLKRPEFAGPLAEIAAERGLRDLPGVCVVADICRDDLLVEIDAELSFPPDRR